MSGRCKQIDGTGAEHRLRVSEALLENPLGRRTGREKDPEPAAAVELALVAWSLGLLLLGLRILASKAK